MDNPFSILPASLDAARLQNSTSNTDRGKVSQDAFLELMITQLKNQDPMTPMQNGEFLSQIAQFGTVSGINDLQKSFGSLASALQSSQALQASTMVGRKVLIEKDHLNVAAGEQPRLGVDLSAAASAVRVTIADASGQMVRQLDLGARDSGITEFTWDGLDAQGAQVPAGAYTVKAQAMIGGSVQGASTLVRAPVESVTLPRDGSGPVLNLTDYGAYQLDAIKRVL
jgi:flagellar basal-body rod modification protein FlgD